MLCEANNCDIAVLLVQYLGVTNYVLSFFRRISQRSSFEETFLLRLPRYRFSFYSSKYKLGDRNIEQPRSDSPIDDRYNCRRDTFDRCCERNVRPPAEQPLSLALIIDLRFCERAVSEPETPGQKLVSPENRGRCLKKKKKKKGTADAVSKRLKTSPLHRSFDRGNLFPLRRPRLLSSSFPAKLKSSSAVIFAQNRK